MVAAAKTAGLRPAALLGALRDLLRVGPAHLAALLAELHVLWLAVAVLHHPADACRENLVEVRVGQPQLALLAGAAGHVAEDLIDQLAHPRSRLRSRQRCGQQAHPAVNIETDRS